MIKIIIADDHPLVREGLKKVLGRPMDMKVIGEASNRKELQEVLENELPDILILDISIPGGGGLEIMKEIKSIYPDIQVLILSVHPEDRYAIRSLRSGAWGYLTKSTDLDTLLKAIRRIVVEKRKYISQNVAEELASQLSNGNQPLHNKLSDREMQVLVMIAKGKQIDEISKELSLSQQTIHTYRNRIKEKLGLKSNVEMTRYVMFNNLLE